MSYVEVNGRLVTVDGKTIKVQGGSADLNAGRSSGPVYRFRQLLPACGNRNLRQHNLLYVW